MLNKFLKINSFVKQQKSTISLGLMIMFWTFYEGIIIFVTPIIITNRGFSNTEMGLLYSCSSLFGILFDFLLVFLLKKTYYRRLLFFALVMAFFYSFFLWKANSVSIFLACMAFWGLYTDIFNFGIGDFSSRFHSYHQNAKSISLLAVFKSIGYIFSPLIASSLLNANVSPQFYALSFIIISFIFFKIFISVSQKDISLSKQIEKNRFFGNAFKLSDYTNIFKKLFPLLLFIFVLYIYDACFWTIGPLLSKDFPTFPNFNGLFLTLNMLPGLFMIFLVPTFIRKIGKKKTAYFTFAISLFIMSTVTFFQNPIFVLFLTFISSFIGYSAYPAIKSTFADYLEESERSDSLIIAFEDIFINLGYVVGPALIGYFSDKLGNFQALSKIALLLAFLTIILMIITPRKISFKES